MPPTNNKTLKRISLLASSFSGSTLFGILLCQDSRFVGFGDTFLIPGISDENDICNCGSSLAKCEFRTRLAAQLELRSLPVGMILDRKYCIPNTVISSRFEGTRFAPIYEFIGSTISYKLAYSTFLKRETGFLESIGTLGNFDYFLDGTKSLIRANIFTKISEDNQILHLIRDPYAVLHSAATRHADRGRSITFNLHSWIRYSLHAHKLCEANKDRSAVILFDDLVTKPDAVLADLTSKLGWGTLNVSSDDLKPEITHLMGNRSRHNATKVRSKQLKPGAEELLALGVSAKDLYELTTTYEYLKQAI